MAGNISLAGSLKLCVNEFLSKLSINNLLSKIIPMRNSPAKIAPSMRAHISVFINATECLKKTKPSDFVFPSAKIINRISCFEYL